MTQAVVTHKAIVVPRCTMRKLTCSELHDESEKVGRIKIEFKIKATFGYSISFSPKPKVPDFIPHNDEVESESLQILEHNDSVDDNGIALYDSIITDHG